MMEEVILKREAEPGGGTWGSLTGELRVIPKALIYVGGSLCFLTLLSRNLIPDRVSLVFFLKKSKFLRLN